MLPEYLQRFNGTLEKFQKKFPRPLWSPDFKESLINDYSFFSTRIEDEKLQYGDTIRFLNDQFVEKGKIKSLLDVSNHKDILLSLINRYEDFKLSEESVKNIHRDLMSSELSWETGFKPHLVGNYRNIPTVGYREPFFRNKEYVPHYNLEIVMATYLDEFNSLFNDIDNSIEDKHLLMALTYFHNIFLNKIHPFADGNGRVCRIIMGTILMKNNCPPIFSKITSEEDRFTYIDTIVQCENENSDKPLVKYLANGMSDYLDMKNSN